MMSGTETRIAFVALMLASTAACAADGPRGIGSDVRAGLDHGRDVAAQWIATGRYATEPSADLAIALGYLERLRLGLGSPFRLIDYALADPRLPDSVRVALSWALLARTIDRVAYRIDPAALDRVGPRSAQAQAPIGEVHLRLIDDAIRESVDPRTGEQAVRLAYTIAGADGSLASGAPDLAARAAGLIRDRELARNDALALLRAAQSEGRSPLSMVHKWRAERRFSVERPRLDAMAPANELLVLEFAPSLAESLAELALRGATVTTRARARGPASLLSNRVALALRAAAEALDAPPQAPISIAARMYRTELLWPPSMSAEERAQRQRFTDLALSEERFVAEHALLEPAGGREVGPALAALAAAVGLRSFAQEPVWFPGFGGPSARELEERYGLSGIAFADDVPAAWRPYYRRMLALALNDLFRVLPALDLDGLGVMFSGSEPGQAGALAVHDPRARRLLLPPETSAGTIAHEVAHDLDWQVALRRYRVRGDYASDRATRRTGDRLALRLQDLAGGSISPAVSSDRLSAHRSRPAEIFARSVDWFIAVSLAAQGIVNGYLSSVQDDVLTGYGTVSPPDVTGTAGSALITILDDVAPVYPVTRESFLTRYGVQRALTPHDLARTVLEAGAKDDYVPGNRSATMQWSTRVAAAFEDVETGRIAGLSAINGWICRSAVAPADNRMQAARRRLVFEVAAARARGLALSLAEQVAGEPGRRWTRFELQGAPRRVEVDSATVGPLREIVLLARQSARVEIGKETRGIALFEPAESCRTAATLPVP